MAVTTTETLATGLMSETTTTLVYLPALASEAMGQVLLQIERAFGDAGVLVGVPQGSEQTSSIYGSRLSIKTYESDGAEPGEWLLNAASYRHAFALAQQHGATHVMLLGPEAQTVSAEGMRGLVGAVEGGADLALAHYELPARSGLVNTAILYPLTRALFATGVRFPLAIDLCCSKRMMERMAGSAQRSLMTEHKGAIMWPVPEAAMANFTITEVNVGERGLPQPDALDPNAVLAQVAGALFAEIEAKAAYWQRARTAEVVTEGVRPQLEAAPESDETLDGMLSAFHLAYANLHEIWGLVLPPQSLLGLKKLSVISRASFKMSDALWARIVYDFLLAYRLRTINRGHLLGALTPLYLAWVLSHLLQLSEGLSAEALGEAAAAAFEADKPYLVSRWRWPDRFNP